VGFAVAVAAVGCAGKRPRPAELRLERNDLALLSGLLKRLETPVGGEVAAARAVWPALNGGLPAGSVPAGMRLGVLTAGARAQAVTLPAFVTVPDALTGPAAPIGVLLKDYTVLTQRGWRLTAAAIATDPQSPGGSRGSAAAARLLRTNSGLYIYCIYDGHFDLSLVGKAVQAAYRTLGGPAAFGSTLTQAQVEGLARAYAPGSVRLEPHPPPGLGV
jgi:hypothetical protein